MSDPIPLYPTPTRLRLLRSVDRGRVVRLPDGESRDYDPEGRFFTVTDRVRELARHRWVRIGGPLPGAPKPSQRDWRQWETTDLGSTVLAEHGAPDAA